ncbi:MAG: DinB family protein [Chloroflexota bacterium]|nr:MAG: DinB family protein [Chloroflexota bacterium]
MTEQPLSQEEILHLFTSSAEQLEELVSDLPDTELDQRTAPGEWSIRQIVHHVADDGDVFSMCIKKALATPGVAVRFEGFPGNEPWAEGMRFNSRSIAPALRLIAAHRSYISCMARDFSDAWDCTVGFANSEGVEQGRMNVGEMLKMLAEHMQEHVCTIEKIKACKQQAVV